MNADELRNRIKGVHISKTARGKENGGAVFVLWFAQTRIASMPSEELERLWAQWQIEKEVFNDTTS